MPATSFLAHVDPETHTSLMANFVASMISVLDMEGSITEAHRSICAAALLDSLGIIIAGLPAAQTVAGRRRLAQGITAELEQVMDKLLADPIRSQCLRMTMEDVVQ